MNQRFQDKVVLISGTSSGIGKKAALTFAEQGAKIILSSRNVGLNEELVQEIKNKGGEALYIQADYTNSSAIQKVIQEGVKHFGGLDIAVNNAGIEGTPNVRTADYKESVWDDVIAVNLKGVWLSMKHQIPVTKEASSEASQQIASTTSFVVPKRPTGCIATAKFSFFSVSKALSAIGVSITAGHTAFTLIFSFAYSKAVAFVIPTTPNFEA